MSRSQVEHELLRPSAGTDGYLTIDRWRNEAAFASFLRDHEGAYKALDAHCETLTVHETRVGAFLAGPPESKVS
jgi:heme-degrading monooxygenase HmoA